ncbi:MAG: hypothetical protein EPO00_08515, partial [Chloroflexota bacterium]
MTYTTGVLVGFRGNREQFTANTVDVDDIEVWDTGSPNRHAPSITAFDAANQVIASIAAPAHAGEAPTVTTSAYDNAGRLTSVTVNAIAGAGTGAADVNLTTTTTYDALGDRINETDPTAVVTHYTYDRGAHVVGSTLNWDGVGLNVTATTNVTSLVGYNDRGETTVICAAAQVQADGCNPATGAALVDGWRYTYDAAGHVATDTPPANAGTALVTTTNAYDTANGGGRLVSSCDATSGGCATPARHTDLGYDELGRPTSSITYLGSGTGTPKLRTVTTYDGAGERTALDYYENGSATTTDALTFGFDSLGRETTIVRAGSPVTTTVFNPDGAPATRIDHAISSTALAFAYDLRGNLVSTTSPLLGGAVTETWRLDGLLESRSWPTGTNAGTFTYDGAKRPTHLAETTSGANLAVFDRTYDRNGTVGSETQTITGLTGDVAAGSQTFTYDPLRRITGATLAGSGATKSYTYDANSNRITATEGGVLAATTYDRTGVQRSLTVDGYTATFVADAYGNLTSSSVPTPLAADTTAPTTPTGLGATANGAGRIDLAWTAATDAVGVTSYAIYRGGVQVMTVAGSVTAWSDRSLNPSTTYSYTVKAVDAAGNQSGASSAANATTAAAGSGGGAITYIQDAGNQITTAATSMTVTLPATPVAGDALIATVGINFSTVSVTSITGGGGTWAPVVTKAGTGTATETWAALNVAGGGSTTITITFSGSAKGAASVAEFSGIAQASAVDATGSVTGGSTTAVSSGNATTTNATDLVVAAVGWRTGAAPTTSPGSPWTNLADQVNSSISNATAWQITSATGTYSAAWTLGASTPGYDGTIAAFKRVAGGDTTPPSVPTGLAVTVATSKQLNLSWTASTDNVGVQGYRVYRDGALAATVGTNAFADTGLAGGSAHTYTVAALDGAGNASAQSTTAAGTTTAPVRTT